MKKFSLILAVVALFASSANAQTPASKAAPAPVAVSSETVAPAVDTAKAEKKAAKKAAKKAKKAAAPVAAPIAVAAPAANPAPASAPVPTPVKK